MMTYYLQGTKVTFFYVEKIICATGLRVQLNGRTLAECAWGPGDNLPAQGEQG